MVPQVRYVAHHNPCLPTLCHLPQQRDRNGWSNILQGATFRRIDYLSPIQKLRRPRDVSGDVPLKSRRTVR